MSKAIRDVQSGNASVVDRKTNPELTNNQMLKEFPKRAETKKAKLLESLKKSLSAKKMKSKKGISKRTNPGTVPSDSVPAHVHREDRRWLKTITKQNLAKRAVQLSRSGKK